MSERDEIIQAINFHKLKLNELESELKLIDDPIERYKKNPTDLDVYCEQIFTIENYVYVVLKGWCNFQGIRYIEDKLNCSFMGVTTCNSIYFYGKLQSKKISPYAYILVFSRRKQNV